jgi:hypothetical protein
MGRARLASWLLCAALSGWAAGPSAGRVKGEGEAFAVFAQAAPPAVPDGAAIRPEFAEDLFKRLAPLRESDGCRLVRFDTHRFRILIGLAPPAGGEHAFELATATGMSPAKRRVGSWALAVPVEIERDCGATLAAVERVLLETAAP